MTSFPSSQLKGNPCEDGSLEISCVADKQADPISADTLRYQRARAMPPWKRRLDIFGALLGLVVSSPLLLIVAFFIKATSRGSIFFRQQRVGYMGQPFTMWKFRTMVEGADTGVHEQYVNELLHSEEPLYKLDRNGHLIPLGKWLRRLCIDELPQLFNVLGGSMSLVGPRPDVVALETYPLWQHRRFDVFPGMTGLWQVSGKNSTTHERMVQLDIEYASRFSMLMDIKILLKTLPVIAGQNK